MLSERSSRKATARSLAGNWTRGSPRTATSNVTIASRKASEMRLRMGGMYTLLDRQRTYTSKAQTGASNSRSGRSNARLTGGLQSVVRSRCEGEVRSRRDARKNAPCNWSADGSGLEPVGRHTGAGAVAAWWRLVARGRRDGRQHLCWVHRSAFVRGEHRRWRIIYRERLGGGHQRRRMGWR